MSEAQRHARAQQRVEELCAAAIRAVSGAPDVLFRGQRLHRGERVLPRFAPHLHPRLPDDDFASFRGAADGLALRLLHSDPALHRKLRPIDPVPRLLCELLEQFRTESLVADAMPGVRHNLRHRFDAWSLAFHDAGGTETARGLLLFTVVQMCRSRVCSDPVTEAIEDLLEATRAALAPALGTALAGLKRHRADQAAYAEPATSIAQHVAAMLEAGDEDDANRDDSDDVATDPWAAFSLLLDQGDSIDDAVASAVSGPSRVLDAAAGGYRVFTTAYDREVAAADLVRADVLHAARQQLDAHIAEAGVNLMRLARELKALLALPEHDGWDSAQEQGLIDGRRLGQLIASPTERRLFRSPRVEPLAACRVTFLIDCSGSMKEHAADVAVLVDVLVRALELIDVATEVLGFTTGAWNGGRAQRDWRRAGRPAHPGRLNEACHIVFKPAAQRWRAARTGMAALLRAELFREGLDGEALEWALRRQLVDEWAAERPVETRRLVFVVSDGSPMDSATSLANDAHYLDQHLRDVVARNDGAGVEIYGLGVGLDLSPYYRRCQVLDLSASVGSAVLGDVLGLLARRRGR